MSQVVIGSITRTGKVHIGEPRAGEFRPLCRIGNALGPVTFILARLSADAPTLAPVLAQVGVNPGKLCKRCFPQSFVDGYRVVLEVRDG